MQAKNEFVAGRLYLQTMYSAGMLPGMRPTARRERKRVQTEAKRKINAMRRLYSLVALFELNFRPGRDLFAELSFMEEPDRKTEDRAIERLHRRLKRFFQTRGREYRYILVRETHNRAGDPVRVHYHLICTGTGQRMREVIDAAWGMGSVDVRALRDRMQSFEDTCSYLLKERKEAGERAYRTSRNLKRPEEPLRRRVAESEIGEVPPGVEPVRVEMNGSNPYGRYSVIVGCIVDPVAFGTYWQKVQRLRRHEAEAATWRKYARQKRKNVTN